MVEFAPVDFLMARNTNSNAVFYIQGKFRKFGKFFYVVGMYIIASFVAHLAGVVIAGINSFAPQHKLALQFASCSITGLAVFIGVGFLPSSTFARTAARTIYRIPVIAVEFLVTIRAYFYSWGVSAFPAGLTAILGCVFAIELYEEIITTDATRKHYLSIFHNAIIPLIEPKYVAVTLERWHEATGKMPELSDN